MKQKLQSYQKNISIWISILFDISFPISILLTCTQIIPLNKDNSKFAFSMNKKATNNAIMNFIERSTWLRMKVGACLTQASQTENDISSGGRMSNAKEPILRRGITY